MPFMDSAFPVSLSANVARFSYGPVLRVLRKQSMKRGERTPGWERPSPVAIGTLPHWDAPDVAHVPAFRVYEAGGRVARRYPVGKAEQFRVEVHEDRVFLGWSTRLDALAWLEALHDFVGDEANALGLIIPESGNDTRGDLTWRETRASLQRSGAQPQLVRIDLGSVSLVWARSTTEANGARESAMMSPAFDATRFEQMIALTGTAKVKTRSREVLKDARLVRRWRPEG
jgi:hypothetical protein